MHVTLLSTDCTPLVGGSVPAVTVQFTKHDDPGEAVRRRQGESDIEGNAVAYKIEAID